MKKKHEPNTNGLKDGGRGELLPAQSLRRKTQLHQITLTAYWNSSREMEVGRKAGEECWKCTMCAVV